METTTAYWAGLPVPRAHGPTHWRSSTAHRLEAVWRCIAGVELVTTPRE